MERKKVGYLNIRNLKCSKFNWKILYSQNWVFASRTALRIICRFMWKLFWLYFPKILQINNNRLTIQRSRGKIVHFQWKCIATNSFIGFHLRRQHSIFAIFAYQNMLLEQSNYHYGQLRLSIQNWYAMHEQHLNHFGKWKLQKGYSGRARMRKIERRRGREKSLQMQLSNPYEMDVENPQTCFSARENLFSKVFVGKMLNVWKQSFWFALGAASVCVCVFLKRICCGSWCSCTKFDELHHLCTLCI